MSPTDMDTACVGANKVLPWVGCEQFRGCVGKGWGREQGGQGQEGWILLATMHAENISLFFQPQMLPTLFR